MQASVLSNINFNQLLNFNHGHKVQVVPPRTLTGQGCMCGCTIRDRPQAVIKRCKLRASLPFQLDILWRIIGLPWVRFQIYHEHTDSMAKHDPKKAKPPTAIWQTQSTGQASSGHTAPADAKSTSNTYLTIVNTFHQQQSLHHLPGNTESQQFTANTFTKTTCSCGTPVSKCCSNSSSSSTWIAETSSFTGLVGCPDIKPIESKDCFFHMFTCNILFNKLSWNWHNISTGLRF